MAAAQPGNLKPQQRKVPRDVFLDALVAYLYIHAAGAAEIKMPPLLGVEVDQHLAMQRAGRQPPRTIHAGFLVNGEQHLQRWVDKAMLFQRGQRGPHADAVVRAQRGVLRYYPAVAHHRMNRVALEIVFCPGICLAHHVKMALQDHAGLRLAAWAGWLLQDQIAHSVDGSLDAASLRPFDQMLAQRRFMQRGARYRAQRSEVRPD